MDKILQDSFLAIIRLGIGHYTYNPTNAVDWSKLQALAERHGLSSIVLDGIERLPESMRPPKVFLLQWIGEIIQCYEQRYELYCRAIADLANFYDSHGLKMMVLKGYTCSLDWPKPEHRPCGDIDIWMFGKQKEADATITSEKGLIVDNSHHHHSVFEWQGFTVENHYDFINVHHHKTNGKFEKVLKEFGRDDSYFVEIKDASTGSLSKVYLPSPNLNALFLLKHMMIHFAAEGIFLRQLLDWGFLVLAHHQDINWKWLEDVLERFGMIDMYNTLNAICVEELGFEPSIFPRVQYYPFLKDKVLNEILSPKFEIEPPQRLVPRIYFKINRWFGSIWKHKYCYNDNLWSAFWNGVWNHILKPASI